MSSNVLSDDAGVAVTLVVPGGNAPGAKPPTSTAVTPPKHHVPSYTHLPHTGLAVLQLLLLAAVLLALGSALLRTTRRSS